jgi:formylglycine-generating enzyme
MMSNRRSLFFIASFLIVLSCRNAPSIDMVYVQGGIQKLSNGQALDTPQNINDFYVSTFEITNELFQKYITETNNVWIEDGYWGKRTELSPGPKNPAIYVSWRNAVIFCNWLSRRDGYSQVYIINESSVEWNKKSNGYRLPTDAEWIWAASGGRDSKGFSYSGSNNPLEVGVFNHPEGTLPVGSRKPNELNIFDMSGNVEEWCWDVDPPSDSDIPSIARAKESDTVFRRLHGGSYNTSLDRIPNIWIPSAGIEDSEANNGFRVVRNK